jgi:hypothetical protein
VDHRQLIRMLAVGRTAVGAVFVLAPGIAGAGWAGDLAKQPAVKVVLRAFGIRDLVIGLGTLRALDRGEDLRPWVQYGLASDVVDAAATTVGFRHLPKGQRWVVLAAATGATAAQAAAIEHLD